MSQAARQRFQGTLDILRYNTRQYIAGVAVIVGCVAAEFVLPLSPWFKLLGWFVIAFDGWCVVASIAASYWIYDASRLMNWSWLRDLVPAPSKWLNLHAGLDESTPALTGLWGPPTTVLDFFDADEMTEPSILRARQLARNEVRPIIADYRQLPVESNAADLACVLFAAHELRSPKAREAFFAQLHRAVSPGGRVIIVEHLRDLANLIVFGPGFMHFMPRSEWLRLADVSGFTVERELRKTPFVACFVLVKR